MLNLKRAVIPGVAGVTIGALLVGAFWSNSGGGSTTALAAPGAVLPAATSSRSTSFQIVNMGTAQADATIKFYNSATGSQLSGYTPSRTLRPGQSTLLDQRGDSNIASGFAGSAVAESSQKLAAIAFEFTEDGGQDAYNALSSDEVAATAVCPIALKNITDQAGRAINSIVHVQNAGSAATTFTADYFNLSGQSVGTEQYTIAPGVSKALVLETNQSIGANFLGAVNISAPGGQIAAAVEQYGSGVLLDYTCQAAGATTVNVPLSVNLNEFRTSTIVANTAVTDTVVNMVFTNFDGQTTRITDTIKGRSAGFYDQGFTMSFTPPGGARESVSLPKPFFGKLKINSTQPIVVVVQQLSQGDVQQLSFRGLPDNKLSRKVILPSIFSQITDAKGINLSTAIAIDNPGTTDAAVTITFQPADGSASSTERKTVGAGRLESFEQRPGFANSIFANAGSFGSITIDSSVPVGVIAQQLSSKAQESDASLKDPIAGYMGIPAS